MSSASNDVVDDYKGQDAIILDDLRPSSLGLSDLLKMLDNNTASSVKSRFANKVFNGKMIVITSTVPLNHWYRLHLYNDNDSIVQLYRRITSYVVVTEKYVQVYNEIDSKGKPSGIPYTYHNEIPELKRQKPKKTDYGTIFGEMLQDASPDIIDEWGRTMNTMNHLKS